MGTCRESSLNGAQLPTRRRALIALQALQTRSTVSSAHTNTYCSDLTAPSAYRQTQHLTAAIVRHMLQRLSSASCRGAMALRHTSCFTSQCPTALRRLPVRSNWHLRAATAEVVTSSQPSSSSSSDTAAAAPAPAYKVPLDFKFVRDNVQLIAENCKLRNSSADPALVAQLYEDFLELKAESEALRASRNENSAAMKVRATRT